MRKEAYPALLFRVGALLMCSVLLIGGVVAGGEVCECVGCQGDVGCTEPPAPEPEAESHSCCESSEPKTPAPKPTHVACSCHLTDGSKSDSNAIPNAVDVRPVERTVTHDFLPAVTEVESAHPSCLSNFFSGRSSPHHVGKSLTVSLCVFRI